METVKYTLNYTQKLVAYTLVTGTPGLSAYMDAVINGGFVGTKQQWLASLRGAAMTWNDLTEEQRLLLAQLIWDSLTDNQKLELKGEPFLWQDFTEEMLAELKGVDGNTPEKGFDYNDGVGINSCAYDPETGIMTITLTDESVYQTGDLRGYTPIKGVDYNDGENGAPGDPGYTPVKGVDYFDGENGSDSTVPGPKGDTGNAGSDANVNATNVETILDAAAAASLADDDTLNFNKSAVLKKITWANIKTALASVFASRSGGTFTGAITTPSVILPSNGQILLTIPDTDGHATGNTTTAFDCGYSNSAIGDLVYLAVNSVWQKADNTISVATYGGLLGIALEVKASGNALKVALPGSLVYATGFPALTVGSPVYMGAAGAVVVAQPSLSNAVIRVIGHAIHVDKIFFNPSSDYVTHI